ncbi:MAG: PqiC family protein [Desulfosarcinaceae bacterium]|nr:PqiC family protein [Desulfosarcinaceae bacterium]
MRPLTIRSRLFLVLLSLAVGFAACRSGPPPIVYYTLDPLPLAQTPPPQPERAIPLRIGVGPVYLPTYLDRAQIVTRSGDHTLAVNDFHRWAGPLDEEIQRVLVVSITKALPGAEVLPYPWGRRRNPTHQLGLTVQRFDGQREGAVHLRGVWQLNCRSDPGQNRSQAFDISEPVPVATMQALVAAQNRALAVLAGQMIDALCALPEGGASP